MANTIMVERGNETIKPARDELVLAIQRANDKITAVNRTLRMTAKIVSLSFGFYPTFFLLNSRPIDPIY